MPPILYSVADSGRTRHGLRMKPQGRWAGPMGRADGQGRWVGPMGRADMSAHRRSLTSRYAGEALNWIRLSSLGVGFLTSQNRGRFLKFNHLGTDTVRPPLVHAIRKTLSRTDTITTKGLTNAIVKSSAKATRWPRRGENRRSRQVNHTTGTIRLPSRTFSAPAYAKYSVGYPLSARTRRTRAKDSALRIIILPLIR